MGLLYALLLTLLVSCSSVSERPGSQLTNVDGPAYLLTVDLEGGETEAEIASRHGGEIVAWVEGEFAVLGLSSEELEARRGDFSLQSAGGAEPNLQFAIDPNAIEMQGTSTLWAGGTSTLWAGGTSRIWAGGTSYLWAGGTSYLWAGGTFHWMPENTASLKQIRLDEAHELVGSSLGAGVRVAVIDTGVDVDHPALEEALAPGLDLVDWDGDPDEEGDEGDAGYGHGTNVAGIVRQIAPRATIVPVRVLDVDGTGNADDLVWAIVWAVLEGDADIINLSLGGAHRVAAVERALDFAALSGVHVVTSTGDSGSREVTFPASIANRSSYLLSLTSVDSNDRKAEWAPFHPTEVEMSSVGVRIYGPAPELKAAAWSGTSMSAPMAAGALALALGAERAGTPLEVSEYRLMDELMASSQNIDHLNREFTGELGAGRLDVANFLQNVLDLEGESGSGHDHRDFWDRLRDHLRDRRGRWGN